MRSPFVAPIAGCMLFLASVSSSLATMYRGVMTLTVTSTTDIRITVGASSSGWYTYESPTVDGTFYGAAPWHNPQPILLHGAFYLPGGFAYGTGRALDTETYGATRLTVQGGEVTDFSWFYSFGPWYVGGNFLHWGGEDDSYQIQFNGLPGGDTSGVIAFSTPEQVPDRADWNYVALTLIAVAAYRHCGGRSKHALRPR